MNDCEQRRSGECDGKQLICISHWANSPYNFVSGRVKVSIVKLIYFDLNFVHRFFFLFALASSAKKRVKKANRSPSRTLIDSARKIKRWNYCCWNEIFIYTSWAHEYTRARSHVPTPLSSTTTLCVLTNLTFGFYRWHTSPYSRF